LHSALVRTIYPPDSGYHWNSGGVCKAVRETCNNERVQAFHKKFYNPKNTCLIVCGMVERENLFNSLKPIVDKIIAKVLNDVIYMESESDAN